MKQLVTLQHCSFYETLRAKIDADIVARAMNGVQFMKHYNEMQVRALWQH